MVSRDHTIGLQIKFPASMQCCRTVVFSENHAAMHLYDNYTIGYIYLCGGLFNILYLLISLKFPPLALAVVMGIKFDAIKI